MESQQILPLLAGLGAGYVLCKVMNPAPKAVAKPKHIKLTYFPIPGRAEVSRLCFAYAGIEIEDNRIDYATWGKMKATCKPWGQLPELVVDGVKVYQSMVRQLPLCVSPADCGACRQLLGTLAASQDWCPMIR